MENTTAVTTDLQEWLVTLENDKAALDARAAQIKEQEQREERAEKAARGAALRQLFLLLGFDPGELPDGVWVTPDGVSVFKGTGRGLSVVKNDPDAALDPWDHSTFKASVYTNDVEINPQRVREELAKAIHEVREQYAAYEAKKATKSAEQQKQAALPEPNKSFTRTATLLTETIKRVQDGEYLFMSDLTILSFAYHVHNGGVYEDQGYYEDED